MIVRTLVWIKGGNDAGRMKLGILMRDKWLCEPVKGCDSEAGDSENARIVGDGTPY
jgi:hypothetical protein